MAEKKSVKIAAGEVPENLEQLSDDDLDAVAGGILANPQLSQTFLRAALKNPSFMRNIAQDSGHCDCWSYTAGMPGMEGRKF